MFYMNSLVKQNQKKDSLLVVADTLLHQRNRDITRYRQLDSNHLQIQQRDSARIADRNKAIADQDKVIASIPAQLKAARRKGTWEGIRTTVEIALITIIISLIK